MVDDLFYHRFVGVLHGDVKWCHVCRIVVERSNVRNIHDVLFICYKVADAITWFMRYILVLVL